MGFLIYKKTPENGATTYEQLKPLKLGGRDGAIARHVKSLAPAHHESWRVDTASLLALAGPGIPVDNTALLFSIASSESASICLYEVVKIHGSCRDVSTQLAIDFAVLIDEVVAGDSAEHLRQFKIPCSAPTRRLAETLALSGGPSGGDWKWGNPPLQLGATVVQAPISDGHGCNNCHRGCSGPAIQCADTCR